MPSSAARGARPTGKAIDVHIKPLEEAGISWWNRLRSRLLLAFGITTMCMGLVTVLGVRQQFRAERAEAIRGQLRSTQQAFRDLLSTQYGHMEAASQLIGDAPRLAAATDTQDPRTVQEEAGWFRETGHADILAVADREETILAFMGRERGESPLELPGLARAIEGETTRGLFRLEDELFLTVTTSIYAVDEIVGAVMIGVRLDDPFARRLQEVAHVDVAFVAQDQLMAASFPRDRLRDVQGEVELTRAPPGLMQRVVIDGRPHLFLSGRYEPAPMSRSLVYYLLRDLGEVESRTRLFERVLWGAAGLFVIIVLLISNELSRRIVGGIQILVQGANEMAKGNFDPPLDIESQDEVGYLAHTMKELSRSVGLQLQKLKRMNENLRGKIEDILFNETLGEHYTDVDILGRGGMGIVYRAHDTIHDRLVAIKILSPMLAERSNIVQRFLREGEIMKRLDHPGVIKVYSTGYTKLPFCEMEYFAGASISDRIQQEGPWSWDRVQPFGVRILEALGYLHEHNVIHRDIKPANILLGDDGDIRIVDFGIAQDMEMTELTKTGDLMGTPAYIAPEVHDEQKVDERVDIFAVGLTFHFMLTGLVPEVHPEGYVPLTGIWNASLPPPPPPEVDRVLERAIAHDRDRRYRSCREFLEDWKGLGSGGAGVEDDVGGDPESPT